MWSGHDKAAQTAGILPAEVWHHALWPRQALSDDGEAAQPRSGGCGYSQGTIRYVCTTITISGNRLCATATASTEDSSRPHRTMQSPRSANAPFRLATLSYRKQHAFSPRTTLTKKRDRDRPNGNSASQGQGESKHELSRIHHELAINIHRPLIAFHRPFIASSQKGAAPGHALFLRQQCTLYILHCTLKKGQNRLASYRRPSGFGICFF